MEVNDLTQLVGAIGRKVIRQDRLKCIRGTSVVALPGSNHVLIANVQTSKEVGDTSCDSSKSFRWSCLPRNSHKRSWSRIKVAA